MKSKLCVTIITLFLFCCSSKKPTKVGIQPFDNFDPGICDTISTAIKKTYGAKTFILTTKPIPAKTFINIKSPRYRADQLIKILKQEKPDSLDYVIGLTTHDISFTKTDELGDIKKPESKYNDWGIFGLGYRPGPSCIVSTHRLKSENKAKFIERVKKVSIHELGHNLGLGHCDAESCVMQDAVETIKTIDLVKSQLCDRCSQRID